MSRFFRENFHKITLLLTAVFWANCGAAVEKQDTPQKEPVKDSIKTAEKKNRDSGVLLWGSCAL